MMRRILTLLALLLFPLALLLFPLTSSLLPLTSSLFPLHAQQVWTAGSVWEVTREEPYISSSGEIKTTLRTIVYTLEEAVDIEGTPYFPLTKFDKALNTTDTIAYIRSEHGDSLVYVREALDNSATAFEVGDEQLLYDFTKRFDYGDVITYGTEHGPCKTTVDPKRGSLSYYYDVIEEGDCLPAWGSLIYKIGALDGPLGLFFILPEGGEGPNPENPDSTEDGDKPKSSNVSHTLFKRKGGGGCMIVPAADGIRVIEFNEEHPAYYDLSGRVYPEVPEGKSSHSSAPHSFFIYKGRKHIE